MKIRFSISPEQLVLISFEATKRSELYKKMLRRRQVLFLVIYALLGAIIYLTTHFALGALIIWSVGLLLSLFQNKLQDRAHLRYFKKIAQAPENQYYFEEQTLSISSKGIESATSKVTSHYKWEAITELTERPSFYLIWVVGNKAWLIPKKIFKKGEQSEFKKWFKNVSSK